MRKSKFTETQIVGILKDAESGVPVPAPVRRHIDDNGARVSEIPRTVQLKSSATVA